MLAAEVQILAQQGRLWGSAVVHADLAALGVRAGHGEVTEDVVHVLEAVDQAALSLCCGWGVLGSTGDMCGGQCIRLAHAPHQGLHLARLQQKCRSAAFCVPEGEVGGRGRFLRVCETLEEAGFVATADLCLSRGGTDDSRLQGREAEVGPLGHSGNRLSGSPR
eukprot:9502435-Pyramimonas_sp.AAC.2